MTGDILAFSTRHSSNSRATFCEDYRASFLQQSGSSRCQPLLYPHDGVCLARNSLTRAVAAVRAAPLFHSGMNSQFGSSFESSSEIGQGCASSLPASTRHGALTVFTNSRSQQ